MTVEGSSSSITLKERARGQGADHAVGSTERWPPQQMRPGWKRRRIRRPPMATRRNSLCRIGMRMHGHWVLSGDDTSVWAVRHQRSSQPHGRIRKKNFLHALSPIDLVASASLGAHHPSTKVAALQLTLLYVLLTALFLAPRIPKGSSSAGSRCCNIELRTNGR